MRLPALGAGLGHPIGKTFVSFVTFVVNLEPQRVTANGIFLSARTRGNETGRASGFGIQMRGPAQDPTRYFSFSFSFFPLGGALAASQIRMVPSMLPEMMYLP